MSGTIHLWSFGRGLLGLRVAKFGNVERHWHRNSVRKVRSACDSTRSDSAIDPEQGTITITQTLRMHPIESAALNSK